MNCSNPSRRLALVRSLRQGLVRQSLSQERAWIVAGLSSRGFRKLGEGAFGVVLGSGNMAVKLVYTRESRGAIAWARKCRAQQTRLLPRVYGIHQVGRYTLVFMEKLREASPRMARRHRLVSASLRRASLKGAIDPKLPRMLGRSPNAVWRALLAVHHAVGTGSRSFLDIRTANVMWRRERAGLRPVLVDPIAY